MSNTYMCCNVNKRIIWKVCPTKTQMSLKSPSERVFIIYMKELCMLSYVNAPAKKLIRLRECEGSSVSSLGAHSEGTFSDTVANMNHEIILTQCA